MSSLHRSSHQEKGENEVSHNLRQKRLCIPLPINHPATTVGNSRFRFACSYLRTGALSPKLKRREPLAMASPKLAPRPRMPLPRPAIGATSMATAIGQGGVAGRGGCCMATHTLAPFILVFEF